MSRTSRDFDKRPRIVIMGAGFAGAYCAYELSRLMKDKVDILVIDTHNYFVFHPLLVEAGVGHLEPRHVIVPLRVFLPRRVRFRVGNLVAVDPDERQVKYRITGENDVRFTHYDHFVLAMGSVTSFPPVPGLRKNAFQVKTLGDAIELRDHIVLQLERANVARSEEEKRRILRMVIVGASYTGAEVAGEFRHYILDAIRLYRNLKPEDCEVILMERGPRILPALSEKLSESATRRLRAKGVKVITGTTISKVDGSTLHVDDGTIIESENLVWCAGIAQNPMISGLPFPKDQRDIILCDPAGHVEGYENAWAIGDCASNPKPGGGYYPPTAQAAIRLGLQAARNIANSLNGKPVKPIRFRDLGSFCVLGSHDGVANVMGIPFEGFPAWWLWRTVYLLKMPGFGRKLRIASDWTVGLFSRPDVVQVGLKLNRPGD